MSGELVTASADAVMVSRTLGPRWNLVRSGAAKPATPKPSLWITDDWTGVRTVRFPGAGSGRWRKPVSVVVRLRSWVLCPAEVSKCLRVGVSGGSILVRKAVTGGTGGMAICVAHLVARYGVRLVAARR